MAGVKILHISDVHLGRKINNLPTDKADIRRSETLLSLERVFDSYSDADIILIAGDLFDGECTEETAGYLAKLMNKYSKIHFFISCGNHDPYDSKVIKLLDSLTCDNVVIFKDKLEHFVIEKLNVCIYGVSFGSSYSYTSLLRDFKVKDKSYINIMVMHADVASDSRYNPISLDEIADSQLDYLALGHIHKHSDILVSGSVRYAYSGVFEPQGFDETYDCGVICGKVDKDDTQDLRFIKTSLRDFVEISVDITGISSNEELAVALKNLINDKDIYKVALCGDRKNFVPDINLVSNLVSGFYITYIDNTKKMTDILAHKDKLTLMGKTANSLIDIKSKENIDEDIFDDACEILTCLFNKGSN